MSVESELIAALSATNIPISNGLYTGSASTYITFTHWTDPEWYSDDKPEVERVFFQVSLFAPITANLTALKAQVKSLLYEAGYSYPSERNLTTEAYGRHIAFDTERLVDISGV